jgi:2-dehydropantoate 2-reductase
MTKYRPSSLIDFQEGREVEIEPIWGEPVRRAEAAGLEMPGVRALYEELKERVRARKLGA